MADKFSRPTNDYVAVQKINKDKFSKYARQKKSLGGKDLDAEFNNAIDAINKVSQDIDDVSAGVFPDADSNANNVIMSIGNEPAWGKIKGKNVAPGSLDSTHIKRGGLDGNAYKDKSIENKHLAPLSVGGAEISLESIENKHVRENAAIEGIKIKQGSLPVNRIEATTESNYGVLGFHKGSGCAIVAPVAEGHFLRTEGSSGNTQYSRIESQHLDKNIIKTNNLSDQSVTSEKIKTIIPEQIISDNPKKTYGVVTFSDGKAGFLNGISENGYYLNTNGNVSGLPSFGRIQAVDLPQGSSPIYMAKWINGEVIREYDPLVVGELKKATAKGFGLGTVEYMNLAFKGIQVIDLITATEPLSVKECARHGIGIKAGDNMAFLGLESGSVIVYDLRKQKQGN